MFLSNSKPGRIHHGGFEDSDLGDDGQPEIAIWPPKPEVLISGSPIYRPTVKITTANLKCSTIASTKKLCLGDFNKDRQPKMASETGSTYISETTRDIVEIPTAINITDLAATLLLPAVVNVAFIWGHFF